MGLGRVVAEEEASGDGVPDIADFIGVTERAGEAMPGGDVELAFGAVDDGFAEGDGKADGGVLDLIVVGEVVLEAPEVVDVELICP